MVVWLAPLVLAMIYALNPRAAIGRAATMMIAVGFLFAIGSPLVSAARPASSAERATILSETISEELNCVAFWFVATMPVLILLLVGRARSRRGERSIPRDSSFN
jgi:hypothetical protein